MPGAPRDGLDSSTVVGLGELGGSKRSGVPDRDQVVISASSKLSSIGAPFKTANLAGVGHKLSDLVLCDAHVVVVDKTRAGTGGQDVLVPSHNTNTGLVAEHASELGALLDVPNLDFTRAETDTNVSAIAGPLHRRNVSVGRALQEGSNGARVGGPDVDGTLEPDGNLVARRPVEQVKVVIINKARGIEDALRC